MRRIRSVPRQTRSLHVPGHLLPLKCTQHMCCQRLACTTSPSRLRLRQRHRHQSRQCEGLPQVHGLGRCNEYRIKRREFRHGGTSLVPPGNSAVGRVAVGCSVGAVIFGVMVVLA
ncbi:hypothetical protein CALCODRAFT_148934 [Calocera cornea HHB12733]|uniref:Uncharacterized protein n=1 Tax=Calocera cornea HHB12733 TaxID=1353952 RepID=A0A165I2U1_9BASI|nr:hypothetical protein CALCODRAFT_148934 [Calocera cornea HHB12733]